MNGIESLFNACMHKQKCTDTVVQLGSAELRIKQLEQELESAKKDQARYKFLRDMPSEDFGNLSTINDDFDCQIDAAIAAKESSK